MWSRESLGVCLLWFIWLLLMWVLTALAKRLLATRYAARDGRLPIAIQASIALGSGAISFALVWWLFDVPGLLEGQRLMVQGDLEGALAAHHPLLNPDPAIVLPVGLATVSGLGVHMAARPDWWFRNGLPGKSPGDVAVDSRAVGRFRIYGIIIASAGLFAAAAVALTYLN